MRTACPGFSESLRHNVEYFLIGRHFGSCRTFFPGALAILLWLSSPERSRPWRLLIFLAVAGSAVGLLILAPYSWSGGGGPTGNRYIIGVYAAIFFLTPPMASSAPALLAWVRRRAVHRQDAGERRSSSPSRRT